MSNINVYREISDNIQYAEREINFKGEKVIENLVIFDGMEINNQTVLSGKVLIEFARDLEKALVNKR